MRDRVVRVRVAASQAERWDVAAVGEGLSLSEWLRLAADARCSARAVDGGERPERVSVARVAAAEPVLRDPADRVVVDLERAFREAPGDEVGVIVEGSPLVRPGDGARAAIAGLAAPAAEGARFERRCRNVSAHVPGKRCRFCGGERP